MYHKAFDNIERFYAVLTAAVNGRAMRNTQQNRIAIIEG